MSTSTYAASRAVQSDNYKAMSAAKLSAGQQRVMNAVLLGHARRQRDFSLNELCLVMEEQLGKRVNPNGISGRVTSLVDSGRLARAEPRACSVTGAKCQPVFAVARQAELGVVQARGAFQGVAKARANLDRGAVQAGQRTDEARSTGMPPEVRARLAALKAAAERGR